MSDLIGNPEDMFCRDDAHLQKEPNNAFFALIDERIWSFLPKKTTKFVVTLQKHLGKALLISIQGTSTEYL